MGAFANEKLIRDRLRRIALDRRRGAGELAIAALGVFLAARPARGLPVDRYLEAISELARRVADLRPVMAPIGSVAERLAADFSLEGERAKEAADAYRLMRTLILNLKSELEDIGAAVARQFQKTFPEIRKPILISYSSRVLDVLRSMPKGYFEPTVCESRPAFEGRKTVRHLLHSVRSITFITESQIPSAMGACDGVLLGCDAIFPDGSIVNKMGSGLLALAGRAAGRPVVVLGDAFKLAAKGRVCGERRPAGEIWASAPRRVRVENEYFEEIGAALIDHIVLESGVYEPGAIHAIWLDRRDREKRLSTDR